MILDQTTVDRHLSLAREIGRSRPLYDMHVSPYEVIFCEFSYEPNPDVEGVHSIGGASYTPPSSGPLRLADAAESDQQTDRPVVPKNLSLMLCRKHYTHIGPRVLGDHMQLSGIGRSLLIPVLRQYSDHSEQKRLMFDVYRDDPRFGYAYCPSLRMACADTAIGEIRQASEAHSVRALKVNPNIQGIDIATQEGRQRLECVLEAGRRTGLPLVVHGGISRLLEDSRCQAYASLDNLASVEWGVAGVPVVLCHAGLFGYPARALDLLLPKLVRLLEANDNLVVDTSGLHLSTLSAVLERVDPDRIVFGSDAHYFPQWSAVVKLLHALEQLGMRSEDMFEKIAGHNPEQRVFGHRGW